MVALWSLLVLFLHPAAPAPAASLSHPEVDAFNVRVGTQTFGPRYHFTTNTVLVETAEAILGMGSDILKFYMGHGLSGQYPGITLPVSVTNLMTLARDEPSCRRVLDMPFRHCQMWSYSFASTGDAWWANGFSASERQKEYDEIYDFSRYLLTNYNRSGKSFYLGHWEGDWYLLPAYNTSINPSPTAILGMIDWLNTRQKAVDDAMRNVPHTNVAVYHYTEVNRVRDAMLNGPTNNQRLVNTVLPYVTNLDFVSWSSYDGMNLGTADLYATLDYIEAHLATNKSSVIPGKRVWVGEYGWGGGSTSADQEPLTRNYLKKLIAWGVRFALFWEMYDNEGKSYWLIDNAGSKTPCYFLHQRLANQARLLAARFLEAKSRLPTDTEFAGLVTPFLDQPLPAMVRLALHDQRVVSITGSVASVSATLEQGVYGDEAATVWVCWGSQDGGTRRENWANSLLVGTNTHFKPADFVAPISLPAAATNMFFRFYATNRAGEGWATNTARLPLVGMDPAAFGSRLKIVFDGYDGGETLFNFPILVKLGTNLPGFSYGQFALPAGGDLRFANASGTIPLAHEIDEWNPNGASYVWVRVPRLARNEDFIWALWGHPLVSNLPPANLRQEVWSDGFELVWHLAEPGLPHADSTGKHPTLSGNNPTWTAAGAIGHASAFNGTGNYLDAGTLSLGQRFTVSAWMRPDSGANSIQTIWASKTGGSATDGFALFLNSWQTRDGKLLFETGNGAGSSAMAATPTNSMSLGQWHHVAVSVNRGAGSARLYVDGVDCTREDTARMDFGANRAVTFGSFADHLYLFRGSLDEARIESEARSPAWIRASWMMVTSNSAFCSYAPVVREPPSLSVDLVDGALRVTWAAAGVGYRLVAATNLVAPVAWSKVPAPPLFTNNRWAIAIPMDSSSGKFYRLEGG